MMYMSHTDMTRKNASKHLIKKANVIKSKLDNKAKGIYTKNPIGGYPT
jgi:hypothetical protein